MAHAGAWRGVEGAMGGTVTLTTPDMPSHGRSADWDENSSFAETVYAASAACLSEPMHVIGHSFGAAIALRLALEHPELVRSATLFEPVFFYAAEQVSPGILRAHNLESTAFYACLAAGDKEGAARAFNRMWSEDGPPWSTLPDHQRTAMARAIHVVPDTTDFLMKDSSGLVPKMAQCQCPILLMRGANSPEIVRHTNQGLLQQLPHAQEAVIPGAGHMAPITHPAPVAKAWRDFAGF